MNTVRRLAGDLLSLLFPELCLACGSNLSYGERQICTFCLFDLPYTDFHRYADNPVAKQFWGRFNFEAATALFYFKKGTKVQQLIHALKYNGQTDLGVTLGHLLGEKLKDSPVFPSVDLVMPVPLHPKREKKRGYNQSHYLAQGVAEILSLPVSDTHLYRNQLTATQTKKSRYHRYENMQAVFTVKDAEDLKNLHILLIDDVITTGATLESCGQTLLNAGIKKISMAAIAFAD